MTDQQHTDKIYSLIHDLNEAAGSARVDGLSTQFYAYRDEVLVGIKISRTYLKPGDTKS